jgi:hypothetical protein
LHMTTPYNERASAQWIARSRDRSTAAWPDAGANNQATPVFTHRIVIPFVKNGSYHIFRFIEKSIF